MDILDQFEHHGKKQQKEHFKNLIKVALADGNVDKQELEMLHRFGRKMGFTDPEIDNLIDAAGTWSFNPPYELAKRFEQLYDIVKMVLADNIIDENEMKLASTYAIKLGFEQKEIDNLLQLLIDGIKQGNDEEDLFTLYKKTKKY